MQAEPIRVLIVEDHALFADALRLLLDRMPDVQVIGVATDGAEAVDLALLNDASVVLMDLTLPKVDGLEATRRLLTLKPNTSVIVLTGDTSERTRHEALAAGARDFLVKGGLNDEIRQAILRTRADPAPGETPA